MSMSTHVVGFRPPDDQWRRMKAVYDSCKTAKVRPPEDVVKFFNYEGPDEAGVEVDLKDCTKKYTAEMRSGIEVDLTKIPKDLKIIRFVNSY